MKAANRGPVTVDSADSDFDTVEGITYLVQVGGFGFYEGPEEESMTEFGRIRLRTN